MKSKHKKALLYTTIAIIGSYFWHQWDSKQKLDTHYLDQLQAVKSRMIYGSPVDSQEELGWYQDHIEICMHLDGYSGPQIMELRCKAFKNAALEG